MPGLHEDAARTRKALRLADALGKLGGTADQAAQLPEAGWLLAAQLADCREPSAATRAVVVTIMAEREARRAAVASNRFHDIAGRRPSTAAQDREDAQIACPPYDPFAGLPGCD